MTRYQAVYRIGYRISMDNVSEANSHFNNKIEIEIEIELNWISGHDKLMIMFAKDPANERSLTYLTWLNAFLAQAYGGLSRWQLRMKVLHACLH